MSTPDAFAGLFAAPIAHRGLHGCGATGPIENSLGAAHAAIARGYGIECDIRLSRDGEAMVFHDARLSRLTGSDDDVDALDAAALTALRLGPGPDRIPTLAALLATVRGRVPLVVEIKSDGDGAPRLTDRALALIADYRGLVALESFDPGVLRHCRRVGATCPLGLVGPIADDGALDRAAVADADFLSWSIARIETATSAGRPLSAWTVRTQGEQARAASAGAQIVFEGFLPGSARTTA